MQSYSETMVVYEEIVNALNDILECSLNDSSSNESNYINAKYEAGTKTKINKKSEEALRRAIESLQHTITSSSQVIKNNLEKELEQIEETLYQIHAEYLIGDERRKIAASINTVKKLSEHSLETDILNHPPQYEKEDIDLTNVDTNKVFSDFERKVIINFPDFFREELAIARGEDPFDLNKEDNTVKLDTIMADTEEISP